MKDNNLITWEQNEILQGEMNDFPCCKQNYSLNDSVRIGIASKYIFGFTNNYNIELSF